MPCVAALPPPQPKTFFANPEGRVRRWSKITRHDIHLLGCNSNVTVVVFDGNQMHDWISIFSGQTLSDGRGISVVQCSWNDISVSLYPSGCLCTIAPIRESGGKKKRITSVPPSLSHPHRSEAARVPGAGQQLARGPWCSGGGLL